MTRIAPHASLLLIGFLGAHCAAGQLSKWLVRAGSGEVRTLDFGGGALALGPPVLGFGLGATEDLNLMTDATGQPLFYSAAGSNNKIQVRNRLMQVMPNGNGLVGHTSSQASAIVPRPCHPQQYYLIHHDAAQHRMHWSTVDMALNGGLGDVTEKNRSIPGEAGEGLAVSRQLPSGCRWLFTYSVVGSEFTLLRSVITDQGVGAPTAIATLNAPNGTAWYSTLKLSPTNDRIALSLPNTLNPGAADIAVWPLDLQRGTVGQVQLLAVSDDPVVGIEFSPGGGYLYFAGNGAMADMAFGRVHLASGSAQVIDEAIGPWVISIECAGNGRLYIGTAGYPRTLAEVRFPDAQSPSGIGYDRNALVFLSLGFLPTLPNAIEGEPPGTAPAPSFVDFTVEELPECGHRFTPSACLATALRWDFGDGWTDEREQPTHHYRAGTFDVALTVTACGQQHTRLQPGLITVQGTQPSAAFAAPDSACQRSPVPFTNASAQATAYQWLFGDGAQAQAESPHHAFLQHGPRTVTLVARNGCIMDTARRMVRVLPAAIASFRTHSDPCDERTYLVNTSEGGLHWLWDFGDGDTVADWRDPNHIYQHMGAFDVTLVSDPRTLCADTARATLLAGYGTIPVAWFVPNAFTPNGDGKNDVLRILGPEPCQSPVMSIHNKWGQLIWEGDAKEGWDGTAHGAPAPEGVYAYVMKPRLGEQRHGWVVLAR